MGSAPVIMKASYNGKSFAEQMARVGQWARMSAAAMSGADPLTSSLFNGGFNWIKTPIYESMFDD